MATGDLSLAETNDGSSSGQSARRGEGRFASEGMATTAALVMLARLLARQAAAEALQAAASDDHSAEPTAVEIQR